MTFCLPSEVLAPDYGASDWTAKETSSPYVRAKLTKRCRWHHGTSFPGVIIKSAHIREFMFTYRFLLFRAVPLTLRLLFPPFLFLFLSSTMLLVLNLHDQCASSSIWAPSVLDCSSSNPAVVTPVAAAGPPSLPRHILDTLKRESMILFLVASGAWWWWRRKWRRMRRRRKNEIQTCCWFNAGGILKYLCELDPNRNNPGEQSVICPRTNVIDPSICLKLYR